MSQWWFYLLVVMREAAVWLLILAALILTIVVCTGFVSWYFAVDRAMANAIVVAAVVFLAITIGVFG